MPILFSDLCLLFDRIASIKPTRAGQDGCPGRQTRPLGVFKAWLSALEAPSHRSGVLIFRLLFPELDVRRRYGLKETLLAVELPKALNFSDPSLAAWKDGDSAIRSLCDASTRRSACFGSALETVFRSRRDKSLLDSPSISLEALDRLLDELASLSDFTAAEVRLEWMCNSRPKRSRSSILADLFGPLSAREAAWLAQIILRDLTPLLYPLPTSSTDTALTDYNSKAYQTLELSDALASWHPFLPAVYRYRATLDAAFEVLVKAGPEAGKVNQRERSRTQHACL